MVATLKRENGEVVILTERELNDVFLSARIAWLKDFVCDLLIDRGQDPETIGDKKIEEITEKYVNNMIDRFGDNLGELENDVFDYTIENDFPEYEEG